MIFVKISQNLIKSHLKICLISQTSVHRLWHVCDQVCYTCADLHLVPLKGVTFFALVELYKVKFTKSPSAMILSVIMNRKQSDLWVFQLTAYKCA